MNILFCGNFEGRGWDGSVTDENHIAEALEELGHEVTRFQREEQINSLTTRWDSHDFTLIAQWDGFGEHFLTCLPRPLVYWAFDHQADGQEWHEKLIAQSDLYLSKRIADSKYPNWQWLSQDFAPNFLKPPIQGNLRHDIDVLFTGSYLPWATERNDFIESVNKEFDLTVHSVNDWPFLERRPPIMDEGLQELYSSARVILSFDHTLERGYWSDRNAQIMACGRRPLFRYVPLSEVRFGDRVDYFYSIEDGLDKIRNWKEKPTNTDGLYVNDRVKDLLTIVESIL